MPLAHVQDACDAHVFLMDAPGADGRYLCAGGSYSMAQIERILSSHYPPFHFQPEKRQATRADAKKRKRKRAALVCSIFQVL